MPSIACTKGEAGRLPSKRGDTDFHFCCFFLLTLEWNDVFAVVFPRKNNGGLEFDPFSVALVDGYGSILFTDDSRVRIAGTVDDDVQST